MLVKGTFIMNEAAQKKEKYSKVKDFLTYAGSSLTGECISKKLIGNGTIGSVTGFTVGGILNNKRKGKKVSMREVILGKPINNWLKKKGL